MGAEHVLQLPKVLNVSLQVVERPVALWSFIAADQGLAWMPCTS